MKRRVREELLNALLIAGGLLLATLGYRLYLIPNNVAPGGFTGIGQIVNHLVPSLGVGLVNLLLNVPLFCCPCARWGWALDCARCSRLSSSRFCWTICPCRR